MGRNGLVGTIRLSITPTANRNSCRVARLVGAVTQGSVLRPQPWLGNRNSYRVAAGCGLSPHWATCILLNHSNTHLRPHHQPLTYSNPHLHPHHHPHAYTYPQLHPHHHPHAYTYPQLHPHHQPHAYSNTHLHPHHHPLTYSTPQLHSHHHPHAYTTPHGGIRLPYSYKNGDEKK